MCNQDVSTEKHFSLGKKNNGVNDSVSIWEMWTADCVKIEDFIIRLEAAATLCQLIAVM